MSDPRNVTSTRNKIKVELMGVHLCCQGCVSAADAALRSVEGATSRCDIENGIIIVVATDLVKALNGAGFSAQVTHGHDHETTKAYVNTFWKW